MPLMRAGRILLGGWFGLLLAPLLLASLARPLAWWDYLTTPGICLTDAGAPLWTAPWVFWKNLLFHTYFLRPTTCVAYQVYYDLFGGEFWIVYLAKWAAKLGAAWIVYRLLARLEVPEAARWAAVSFALFHPAAFELMAFAPDGWAAAALLLFLWVVLDQRVSPEGPFAVDRMPRASWLAVMLMIFLFAGLKEVAIVFFACYVAMAFWLAASRRRAASRLALPAAYLAFLVWRMSEIARHRPFRATSVSQVGDHLGRHFRYLIPASPFEVMGWLMAGAMILLVVRLARRPDRTVAAVAALCALFVVGALVMVSGTSPAARYVVPPALAAAVLLGLGLGAVPARGQAAVAVLAAVFPLVTAGNLYAQHLAYQQLLYECADVLALLDQKHAAGLPVAVPGADRELAAENRASVMLFFERFRQAFWHYGAQFDVIDLSQEPAPPGSFAVVATQPAGIEFPGRDRYELVSAEAFRRGGYGLLERLTGRLQRFSHAIGNEHRPYYDLGAPMLNAEPELFVLTYAPRHAAPAPPAPPLELETIRFPGGARERRKLDPARAETLAAGAGEGFVARVSLGEQEGAQSLAWRGQAWVVRGAVTFGITDDKGRDVWNTGLPPGAGFDALPGAPRLRFPRRQEYFLFFFSPAGEGAEIRVKGMVIEGSPRPVRLLTPSRRYGALAM